MLTSDGEQGAEVQMLSTQVFHGERREPVEPIILTNPIKLLQELNGLVMRLPKEAWHCGDKFPINAFMSIWAETVATQARRMK